MKFGEHDERFFADRPAADEFAEELTRAKFRTPWEAVVERSGKRLRVYLSPIDADTAAVSFLAKKLPAEPNELKQSRGDIAWGKIKSAAQALLLHKRITKVWRGKDAPTLWRWNDEVAVEVDKAGAGKGRRGVQRMGGDDEQRQAASSRRGDGYTRDGRGRRPAEKATKRNDHNNWRDNT